ncbi:MAG TPA: ankyrin repeat domain-containing protein, partial [Rhabdochlamydiaceae bacterium]
SLMRAAYNGHLDAVRILLAVGIDPNAKDCDAKTALMAAAHMGHRGVALVLLAAGADPNAKANGGAAAVYAVKSQHPDIARLIFSYIQFMDSFNAIKTFADGINLIYAKARQEDIKELFAEPLFAQRLIDALIEKFPQETKRDVQFVAELLKIPGAIKLLLERLAVRTTRLVKEQLALDADLNVQGEAGETTLMMIVNQNRADLAQMLLDAGANANIQDKIGRTALMLAVMKGYQESASTLLNAKADVNAKDTDGRTALTYAVLEKNAPLVQLLLDAGADPFARAGYIDFGHPDEPIIGLANVMGDRPIIALILRAQLIATIQEDVIRNFSLNTIENLLEIPVIARYLTQEYRDKEGRTALMIAAL